MRSIVENRLSIVAAVADEIACFTDLIKGKPTRCPAAIIRGLAQMLRSPGVPADVTD